MGASAWSYRVPYQADLNSALKELKRKVFAEGDYWWVRGEIGKAASDYENRPATIAELWEDEWVQESGTHSILDMHHVLAGGEKPDYCTVEPVRPEEALKVAGTEKLTGAHVEALDDIELRRWFGRCAVLYGPDLQPEEIYFWGYSGD